MSDIMEVDGVESEDSSLSKPGAADMEDGKCDGSHDDDESESGNDSDWDDSFAQPQPPFETVLKLWNDVAEDISKDETFYSKAAWSLEHAHRYLSTSPDARAFVDKCMVKIIRILLEAQLPIDMCRFETDCVEKSLRCSLQIVNDDLEAMGRRDIDQNLDVSTTLDALGHIFDKKKVYYKSANSWEARPKLRLDMIKFFQEIHGFKHLVAYLNARATTAQFPSLELVRYLLEGASSFISCSKILPYIPTSDGTDQSQKHKVIQEELRQTAQVIMKHMLDEPSLMKVDATVIPDVCCFLRKIYVRPESKPEELTELFTFWRSLALRLIMSQTLSLKLSGWDQLTDLVAESERMCPPPQAYVLTGAGTSFVNGRYDLFDPNKMAESGHSVLDPKKFGWNWENGYPRQYHREIPSDGADSLGAGKLLTLFRCTMRSQHRWWFLSEAHKDEPATDKDIDYYQHKSKKNEDDLPSHSGWLTCRAGADPAPTLKPLGLAVPAGEEFNTPEHQLATLAIENRLVELALGGDSTDSEVLERSIPLLKFLARMCNKFDWLNEEDSQLMDTDAITNQFCLKESHLHLARETCAKTADAIVAAKIYMLLLSLRPSLPEHLKELSLAIEKNALIRRIELNDPSLLELQIGSSFTPDPSNSEVGVYEPIDGADFARLGDSIGNNIKIERVHFDSTIELEEMKSALTEGLKQNISIRCLKMTNCVISETTGVDFNAFTERSANLTDLSLLDCDIGNGGNHLLASAISNCKHLKKINLTRLGVDDERLTELIAAVRCHNDLETLCLSGNMIGRAGCSIIADLLKDQDCNLVTLDLLYNRIDSIGTIALANSLSKNTKLVKLSLFVNDNMVTINDEAFDAFHRLVYDTTSVNATYLSNHTIEDIGHHRHMNSDLRGYLRLNAKADKDQVAILKILHHHCHFDVVPLFEWDLKALPDAVGWFERARACIEDNASDVHYYDEATIDSEKLSAIYQFARAMPLLFVPASQNTSFKRKRQSP